MTRRSSIHVTHHLLFHTLCIGKSDVSAKVTTEDKREENAVRCDLRVFLVTRARTGGIIIIVGQGTALVRGYAVGAGAGGGTGPRKFRYEQKQPDGSASG
jgi:hypothetical protein